MPLLAGAAVHAVLGSAPVGVLFTEWVLPPRACAPGRDASDPADGEFALSVVGNVAGARVMTFLLLCCLRTAEASLGSLSQRKVYDCVKFRPC